MVLRMNATISGLVGTVLSKVQCARTPRLTASFLRMYSAALNGLEKPSTTSSDGIRINKCFPQFSRVNVDRIVQAGRVKVNGVTANVGYKLKSGDSVTLDDKAVEWEKFVEERSKAPYPAGLAQGNGFVYIKYYKGENVSTTTSENDPEGILNTGHFGNITFPQRGGRLLPVGRLDKGSTGIILLTSDARLPAWLLGANSGCSKVYHVQLDRPPSEEHLQQWAKGVRIATPSSSGKDLRTHSTMPCKVRPLPPASGRRGSWVEFTLKEGRNRQLRRMVHALGYTCRRLHRVQFGGVGLGGLNGEGQWAHLTEEELQQLRERK